MDRQRFQFLVVAVDHRGFSLMDYYDESPPHVSLQCGECQWRQDYPSLAQGPKAADFFAPAREHEKSCPARAGVSP